MAMTVAVNQAFENRAVKKTPRDEGGKKGAKMKVES
jgi:hypothetical protein